MNPAFTLKGFDTLDRYSHSMNLERNISMFFDYACISIGGYQNFISGQTFMNQNLGALKPVKSTQYALGKVWEGFRTNWMWESGSGINPIDISGIYINNVFTTSGFNIDWKRGQVILDSGISTSSTVSASFSAKTIYWDTADAHWYRELITETFKYDTFNANGISSGIRSVLNDHRIQMPAVIVEVTSENNFEPYQLGGGSWYNPKIRFYVFTENPDQKKLITDLICNQNEHSFLGLDFNKMRASGDFPYNQFNFLNSGAKTFPQLQALYPWDVKPISFENLTVPMDVPYIPYVYRAMIVGNANLILYSV